jgi:NADPH:quinone reductase
VQLAKALGADLMIATTTSDTKADALTAVGADVVVNTTAEDLAEIVTRATGGTGVDIVLDHVGGELFSRLFAATRVGGTIINIGRLAGPKATIDLDELSFRRLRVLGTTFSIRTAEERGEVAAALVPEVLPAVADGRIRPVVDSVFPFEEAKRACARQQIERRVERRYRGSQIFFSET